MLSLIASSGFNAAPTTPRQPQQACTRSSCTLMQIGGGVAASAATAAAAVIEETSRAVATKGVEAPDADRSFVSMDQERAGLVDDEGLPLIYDKDAIQSYWAGQGGALQQRWIEFLGVSVPFITRVAGLLISGGTDALEDNAAELAQDARVNLEKLGPTYIKVRHAGPHPNPAHPRQDPNPADPRQDPNPADPRQCCYSRACASPWTDGPDDERSPRRAAPASARRARQDAGRRRGLRAVDRHRHGRAGAGQ